jgi:hypothetical protein
MGMGALKRKRRDTVRLRIVRDPMDEPTQSRVKLVTLFSSVDIQKDYFNCSMVYDGRIFRKLVPWSKETLEPTRDEMKRFVMDIINAAKRDREIRDYMRQNPFPFLRKQSF